MPANDDPGAWFVAEVLPLEGVLERYLRRNWRDADEIPDLRQEVYARVFDACAAGLPQSAQALVLTVARNLLIDRARRAQVVSIEACGAIEELDLVADHLSPERHAAARSELRRVQAALERLPPRCREVVELRKVHGLSQREVAARLGVTQDTVEKQVARGVRALAEHLGADLPADEQQAGRPTERGRRGRWWP